MQLARSSPLHPSHGVKLRYANPIDGGYVYPTIATFVQACDRCVVASPGLSRRRVGALGRCQISARVKQAFRYCALFRFGHSAPEIIKFPRKQPWSIWRIVLKAPLAPHSPSPQGPRASSPAVAESSQATDGGARLISPLNQD
jgi:hypothetical protein